MQSQFNNLKIEVISPEKYITGLKNFKMSTFNMPDWVLSMANNGNKPIFIHYLQNEQVIAKSAGLIAHCKILKNRVLYFFCYPSVLCEYSENEDLLLALKHLAQKLKIPRVIISSYDQRTCECIQPKGYSKTERNEFVIDLTTHSESDYSRRFKNNLKKSRKHQIEVVESKNDNNDTRLLNFMNCTLNERTESRHRKKYNPLFMPYMDCHALKNLAATTITKFYEVVVDGEIHGVALLLENIDHVIVLMYGIDKAGYESGCAAYMFNHFIKTFTEKGMRYINLGGVPDGEDGENLTIFKESMGAKKIQVYGATTNFLTFPHFLANPAITIARNLCKFKPVKQLKDKIYN